MRLRPGHPVLTYDEFRIQVGLDPRTRVMAPNTAPVRAMLAALTNGRPLTLDPVSSAVLEDLRCSGLVVDSVGEIGWQAAYGDEAVEIQRRRESAMVDIDAPDDLARGLAVQLRSAGVRTGSPGSVVVVADHRPVGRGRVDDLVRADTPHLLLTGLPVGWVLGPFVIPGHTACARCVDLHLAGGDPRFPHLLEEAACCDPVPEPDAPLLHLVLAWAARELLAFIDGDLPATATSTVTVGRRGAPVTNHWGPHPGCGCTWDMTGTAPDDGPDSWTNAEWPIRTDPDGPFSPRSGVEGVS